MHRVHAARRCANRVAELLVARQHQDIDRDDMLENGRIQGGHAAAGAERYCFARLACRVLRVRAVVECTAVVG